MGAQRRRLVAVVGLVVTAGAIAACGEEDFANDPRPSAPIDLSARIGGNGVVVSPREAGAGIVTITISNQTPDPQELVLEGPTDESSGEIVPNGTGSMKVNLREGDYRVTDVDGELTTKLVIGPERASSSNELGLP